MNNVIQEQFKTYLQQLGYRKTTVHMLPACVKEFLAYHNIQDVKQASSEQIKAYYEHLQTRPNKRKSGPLSETFIHHHIYALKVFFNWLEQTGQIKTNPISHLKFKRPTVNTREPLTQEQIQELFAATTSHKEIAILHLFYSCGLRRTEAENLNTADIHFDQNLLYVREGKGAKRRVIPITEKVKQELWQYFVSERKNVSAKDDEAFMLNKHLGRMRGDLYNEAVQAIVARTDFYQSQITIASHYQITLHHLRHSIATHLLENGVGIEYVRDFLGHSQLETTQLYAKVKTKDVLKL